jgi:hypothetical protein
LGVFAPAQIHEVDVPILKRSPDPSRDHIDDATYLILHQSLSWQCSMAIGCAKNRADVDSTLVSVATALSALSGHPPPKFATEPISECIGQSETPESHM